MSWSSRPTLLAILAIPLLIGVAEARPASDTDPMGYEIKKMVEPADLLALLESVGFEREDAEVRSVWFIDTSDLSLLERGVILRARQRSSDRFDTTVKLRGDIDFADFEKLLDKKGFKTEVDRIGSSAARSASWKKKHDGHFDPADPLDDFKKKQLRFVEEHAGIDLDALDLRAFGPIRTEKWEGDVEGLDGELTIERWTLADGSVLVETSTKIDGDDEEDLDDVIADLDELLAKAGVTVAAQQGSKTRRSLSSFLAAESGDAMSPEQTAPKKGITEGLSGLMGD